jgi:hypothetical protein
VTLSRRRGRVIALQAVSPNELLFDFSFTIAHGLPQLW